MEPNRMGQIGETNYQNVVSGLNIVSQQSLIPGVYVLHKDKITKQITPVRDLDKFELPPKLYGDLDKLGNRCWNTFARHKDSMGCLFLGAKGLGKTELTRYICNIGISFGLPVIVIINLDVDQDVLRYLHNLSDVIIVFEEFGKTVPYHFQEKMLTTLSSFNNKKKMFIVNDNDRNGISKFILGRAGRFRYIREFYKATRKMVEEYLEDFKVNKQLKDDILDLHSKTTTFSMDDLKHVVEEHFLYPEDTLEELLSILNVGIENKVASYKIGKVIDIDNDKEMNHDPINIPKLEFDTGRTYWLNIYEKPEEKKEDVVKPEVNPFGGEVNFFKGGNRGMSMPSARYNIKLTNNKIIRSTEHYTLVNSDCDKYQVKLIFEKE